jgi:hypothetical protein
MKKKKQRLWQIIRRINLSVYRAAPPSNTEYVHFDISHDAEAVLQSFEAPIYRKIADYSA